MLTRAFAQRDLGELPRIWGDAWKVLRKRVADKREVDILHPVVHDVERSASGDYVSTGKDPFIVHQLQNNDVDGGKFGLLAIDFQCKGQKETPILQIFWANELFKSALEEHSVRLHGRNGRLIAPLDSSPAWVLGGRVENIRIDLDNPSACESWMVQRLFLAQRASR
jgi:hypothetical protein